MTIKILSLLILIIISGCIETDSVRSTIKNKTIELKQYTENVSLPESCIRIDKNTTCISNINVSVKIDK